MSTTDERDPMPATPTVDPAPEAPDAPGDEIAGIDSALSRRGFLRVSALAGLGATAATVAACTTGAAPAWTFPPAPSINPAPSQTATAAPSVAPSASATAAPSPSASPDLGPIPPGWTAHDIAARNKVRRFVGKLAVPLAGLYPPAAGAKLAEILGVADNYPELQELPEFAKVTQGNAALQPKIDGDVKVFDLSIDKLPAWQIDALTPPLEALGYNGTWPGPILRVTEGDKVRVNLTNKIGETTGTHMHGIAFDDFFMDGVPFVTQLPQVPDSTESYEFVAKPYGSMMYHSHHNATFQVGHGMLGALIIDPKDAKETYKEKYGVTQEYTWISNDSIGGFTINGHGFPAVVPIVAALGEKVLIRFMNEGIMMHPWHLHGYRMKVVARDGAPLGSAAFECDTLGVNPGERWDAIVEIDRPGLWAFHCHILPHVEGPDGMFGMVNVLIVTPEPVDLAPLLK
jgi:FtsP/CotA-like multicopper oxidase with cupredoxin domain